MPEPNSAEQTGEVDLMAALEKSLVDPRPSQHSDIAVTWPKGRKLGSYYAELENAKRRREVINFRVPTRPRVTPERCYMVYDGFVRCWTPVTAVVWRGPREVRHVSGGWWREGYYVVRDPVYTEIEPVPMNGFRGFRLFDRSITTDKKGRDDQSSGRAERAAQAETR